MRFLFLSPLLALPAFAQDIPVAPEAAPVVGGVNLDANPLGIVPVLTTLAQEGKWGALALVALFAAVWAVRKFASKLPAGKVREALLSRWGGWGLNLAMALAGGFASLALTGVPVTATSVLGVLGGAVSFALGAAGFRSLQQDVLARGDAAKTKAEAGVTDAESAVAVFNGKGPQP